MGEGSGSPTAPKGAEAARVAGYLLVLLFFALGFSSSGLTITFHGSLSSSSVGELNFWLGHALFVFPACLLIGYGFAWPLGNVVRRAASRVDRMSARERAAGVLALTALAIATARVGRAVFLLDLPVTDDEYAVDFGGRILASGDVMTRLPIPREALPDLFLHFRNGAVGSFDWIGGQAIAAVAELTRLGPLVWAVVAAAPVAAIAVLMGRSLGPRWGFAAALLFLCSPMASLLSMTTHTHLAARAFLAGALLAFWMADRFGGFGRWALTGCLLGLGVLCRPLEIAFFSIPIVAWTVAQSVRRAPSYSAALPGLLIGGLGPAAVFLWHAYAMTGNPLLPARFANPDHQDVRPVPLFVRLGDNVSYNVLMLAIWFLGPLGMALIAAGVLTNRFTKLLGACVVADLCLALAHDNSGLHIVGPIHYSECAAPLTIIATHGLANVVRAARSHSIDPRMIAAPVATVLVLGLGTFTAVQALALREQAKVQRQVYEAVEEAAREPDGRKAVVLAPPFHPVVLSVVRLRDVGTWVHDWRRPRLDLSDDVLFLRDDPRVESALRNQFPDRRIYRMQRDESGRSYTLVPLDGGDARPLPSLLTSEL